MFYSLCLIHIKICYKNNQHIDYNIYKTTRNLISDRSLDCIGAKITIFERSNMENIEATPEIELKTNINQNEPAKCLFLKRRLRRRI